MRKTLGLACRGAHLNRWTMFGLIQVGLPATTSLVVRFTGCPNGCTRPYMAELGFVGDGPNSYQVTLKSILLLYESICPVRMSAESHFGSWAEAFLSCVVCLSTVLAWRLDEPDKAGTNIPGQSKGAGNGESTRAPVLLLED